MSVYQDMLSDWMHNFDPPIPAMLQSGIRVMIYAGVEDFICNWVGNQRWVDSLPWYATHLLSCICTLAFPPGCVSLWMVLTAL